MTGNIKCRIRKLEDGAYAAVLIIDDDEGHLEATHLCSSREKARAWLHEEVEVYESLAPMPA